MRRGVSGVVLAVAAALAGCGGSSKTVTVTTPTTTGSSTTSAVTASTTSAGATTPAGTTTATATTTTPAAVVHLTTFRSPSGNIGCVILGGVARCDIQHRSWSPGPRPSSCPKVVDYGQGVQVTTAGPAALVCAGDTALDPSAPTLAYATADVEGPVRCVSATAGITCTNTSTGHGFFISAQSYKVS